MIAENLISVLGEKIVSFAFDGFKKSIEKRKSMPETHGKTLYRYLTERNFQITNIPNDLTINKGCVIWPIALQPSVTYIHTAQIQLINLLVKQGWNLHVIIGDCGKHSHSVKDSNPFKNSIISLLKRHASVKIKRQTVTLLGNYYQRNPKKKDKSLLQNVTSLELLNTFHNISDSITWQTYWEYITKNYDTDIKDELQKRKILNNIQPLLIWALVITITRKYKKTIVVAGEDEKMQWDSIISRHGDNKIGIIYIYQS